MPDREKVIKGLGRHCEGSMFDRCGECPYYDLVNEPFRCRDEPLFQCRDELLEDVFALLKEQEEEIENLKQTAQSMMEGVCLLKEQEEPKQIVRKQCKKEHSDGSIDYFAEWYCPHCDSLILRGFDNPSIKFCYKCGKPVLWEGR